MLCSSDKNSLQLGDNTARPLALMKGVTTAWKPNATCSVAFSIPTNRRRLDQRRADDRSRDLFMSSKTVTTCMFYSAAPQRTGSAVRLQPFQILLGNRI